MLKKGSGNTVAHSNAKNGFGNVVYETERLSGSADNRGKETKSVGVFTKGTNTHKLPLAPL